VVCITKLAARVRYGRHAPRLCPASSRTGRPRPPEETDPRPLLREAYCCHGRNDTESARRLFRPAFHKADWKAGDFKHLGASLLPAAPYRNPIDFVTRRRSVRIEGPAVSAASTCTASPPNKARQKQKYMIASKAKQPEAPQRVAPRPSSDKGITFGTTLADTIQHLQ